MQLTFKDVSSAMEYCKNTSEAYKHTAEQNAKILNNLVEQAWESTKHRLVIKRWFGPDDTLVDLKQCDTPLKKYLALRSFGLLNATINDLAAGTDFVKAQAEVHEARYNALKSLQDNEHDCSVTIDIVGEK